MEKFKSYFVFHRQQRNGILCLIILIVVLLSANYFIDFSQNDTFYIHNTELQLIKKELDSLKGVEVKKREPRIFPFNPNFITDFKGYALGMSPEEIDRLLNYRAKDKWINSTKDFQKITKISDSLLAIISPYFKFPEWVTNPRPQKKSHFGYKEKKFEEKIDLNKVKESELQQISGVGPTLSSRIISFRNKMEGFTDDKQLYHIYGLKEEVLLRILNEYTVKSPKKIEIMPLNFISASDIATIPGVSFDLAKRIWEYRILNERIDHFSELEKIEGITPRKLIGIQLYLTLD